MDIKISSAHSPSFRQLVVRKNAQKAFETFIQNNNEGNETAILLIKGAISSIEEDHKNNPIDIVVGWYGKSRKQLGVSIQQEGKKIINTPVIFEKGVIDINLEKYGSLESSTLMPKFLHVLFKAEKTIDELWEFLCNKSRKDRHGETTLNYMFKQKTKEEI